MSNVFSPPVGKISLSSTDFDHHVGPIVPHVR